MRHYVGYPNNGPIEDTIAVYANEHFKESETVEGLTKSKFK